jgi:serine/threonine-protein kinase
VVGELADLHEQGIVHCDVKPENFKYTELTRTRSRCARVFDLGIACREGERHPFIMGTPDYMSPESWNPQNANGFGRDVFALGVTLYWLLTGKLPFEGETPEATARNAMTVTPEPPSEVLLRERPDLIDAFSMNDIGKLEMLDQIIMRALNRDEGVRFYDAGEMLAELERGFRDHEVVVVADRRRVRRISVG